MEIVGVYISLPAIVLTCIAGILICLLAVRERRGVKLGEFVDYKSTIVSVGVLFTFIGICWALWNFNANDIEASVPQLLEGLKVAFLTSILGMGVAVGLSITEKREAGGDDIQSAALVSIDKKLTAMEEVVSAGKDTVDQIRNFRMEVRDEQLKSRELVSVEFEKTNESLKLAIDTLAQGATKEIISALEHVISDFNRNLTEQFGDSFKRLNEAVHEMVVWQDNYRKQIAEETRLLNEVAASLRGSTDAMENIAKNSETILSVHQGLADMLEMNRKRTMLLDEQLKTQEASTKALQALSDGILESTKETKNQISGLSEKIQSSLSEQSRALTDLTRDIGEKLPSSLSELDRTLAGLTERFATDYESFLARYQGLVGGAGRPQ